MNTKRSILIAFILNLVFSVFEFFGGLVTGSIAIISDSLHDAGDAVSIGISYICERKSDKMPDEKYTFGYGRYSVLGAAVSTIVLIFGSSAILIGSVSRLFSPVKINYNGMIVLAIIGVSVNSLAVYFTHRKGSLNEKAVNLHMLEDVLGWIVVLLGAVFMRFTGLSLADPILSVCTSVFIATNAIIDLRKEISIFLEKAPPQLDTNKVKDTIEALDCVSDVHHIHIWTIDGGKVYATLHVKTNHNVRETKVILRKALKELGISHVTVEFEEENEYCNETECKTASCQICHHSHIH